MGKQRRNRKSLHLEAVKPQKTDVFSQSDKMVVDEDQKSIGKLSFKLKAGDQLFNGLDIAVDKLNTCLDNDGKSVHSLAKTFRSVKRSLGGQSMKKDDKRKLRRDMFMSKIDAFYKNKNLKQNKKPNTSNDFTVQNLDTALPKVDMMFHVPEKKEKQSRPVSNKQKGIKKAKQRQKEHEQNYEALKKLMQDAKSKDQILDIVSDHVESQILSNI